MLACRFLSRQLRPMIRPAVNTIQPRVTARFYSPEQLLPKKLGQLVKLDLLLAEPQENIKTIWNTYHETQDNNVADTLEKTQVAELYERIEKCPSFVYPVLLPDGAFFTLYAEWQGKSCMMTYLEDYKNNPLAAQPYLAVNLYDDLLEEKNIALVRGELSPAIDKPTAQKLLDDVKYFYLGDGYHHVETFNLDGTNFDFSKAFPSVLANAPKQ